VGFVKLRLLVSGCFALAAIPASGMAAPLPSNVSSCIEQNDFTNYLITAARVEGAWIPQQWQDEVARLSGVGKVYEKPGSPAAFLQAIRYLNRQIREMKQHQPQSAEAMVVHISRSLCDVSTPDNPKRMAIHLLPYVVGYQRSPHQNEKIVLPYIYTPNVSIDLKSSFVLGSGSTLGVQTDRNYGLSAQLLSSLQISDDLQLLPTPGKSSAPLALDLDLRKGLENGFYDTNVKLLYSLPSPSQQANLELDAAYLNRYEPLGDGRLWQEGISANLVYGQKQAIPWLTSYALGAGFRSIANQVSGVPAASDGQHENGIQLFAIAERRKDAQLLLGGMWYEAADPGEGLTYSRLAGRLGTRMPLGAGHNSMDVDLVAGFGQSWGDLPAYARFFGGYTPTQFLNGSSQASHLRDLPEGPVIRSFGEQQLRLLRGPEEGGGGTRYWSANLTIAVPVAAWSRPLIPDVTVDVEAAAGEEEDPCDGTIVTLPPKIALGELVKFMSRQGAWNIIKQKINDGKSEEEAIASTCPFFKSEVMPVLDNLVDRANLYSVKPLLMADVGQLGSQNAWATSTYLALGGGLQVSLTNLSLQLGYMHTLAPSSEGASGNFFASFVLRDLF